MSLRKVSLTLLAFAGALTVAVGAVLLIHPYLITGEFYEMEIKSVSPGLHGEVQLDYDDRIACNTQVIWEVPADYEQKTIRYSWDQRSRGGSLRPIVMHGESFRFFVGTEEERKDGGGNRDEFRRRLLIKEG